MSTAIGRWARNLLVAVDQLLGAVLGGDPDETISSRAAKARVAGRAWGCWLCRLLDALDPGHCQASLEADEGRDAVV